MERYKCKRKGGMRLAALFFIILLGGILSGCSTAPDEGEYRIEYLNKEKTRIVPVAYEPKATKTGDLVREFLAALCSDTDEVEYRKPIPSDVEVTSYSLDGALLTLWFDADYKKMGAVEEVLCRAVSGFPLIIFLKTEERKWRDINVNERAACVWLLCFLSFY